MARIDTSQTPNPYPATASFQTGVLSKTVRQTRTTPDTALYAIHRSQILQAVAPSAVPSKPRGRLFPEHGTWRPGLPRRHPAPYGAAANVNPLARIDHRALRSSRAILTGYRRDTDAIQTRYRPGVWPVNQGRRSRVAQHPPTTARTPSERRSRHGARSPAQGAVSQASFSPTNSGRK